MNKNFRVVFSLRGDYKDSEGKSPIQTRIYIGSDRLRLGGTGFFVNEAKWDNKKYRGIGKTADILHLNSQLDHIETDLKAIFRRLEFSEELSLDSIKSEYLGDRKDDKFLLPFYDEFIETRRKEVGITRSTTSIQKYIVVKKCFQEFLAFKYKRKDIKFCELRYEIISGFEHYLLTEAKCQNNTVMRMLRTFKTVIINAMKHGILDHDPFVDFHIHFKPTDRGFLTDEELAKMIQHDFDLERLEHVRDTFIFSCFTGLAYIDLASLTKDNIVYLDGKPWIMTRRHKTNVASNIPLLDIPRFLIEKYEGQFKDGRLLPILSNQKQNAYLKEIATLCGIKKNLTCHLARHTFATLALSKGVPVESVSKMLGHTNIKTTQIYAKITNKKVENDMNALAKKLEKFSLNNFIN